MCTYGYAVQAREGIALVVQGRIDRGAMDAGLAAQILWTMNHGVTSLLISNPNFPWAEREALLDGVVDCALAGLRG
jgi:hypothetical protein